MSEHSIQPTGDAPHGAALAHGSLDHTPAEIDRHVKAALMVFGSLLVLTGFTVGAYFLHLPTRTAIALALTIATAKGTLVAAWFMHLISEKKLIWWMLAIAAACFIPLLLFPTFTMLGAISPR
jgi:caa(3)-type oxidase subunit IV